MGEGQKRRCWELYSGKTAKAFIIPRGGGGQRKGGREATDCIGHGRLDKGGERRDPACIVFQLGEEGIALAGGRAADTGYSQGGITEGTVGGKDEEEAGDADSEMDRRLARFCFPCMSLAAPQRCEQSIPSSFSWLISKL